MNSACLVCLVCLVHGERVELVFARVLVCVAMCKRAFVRSRLNTAVHVAAETHFATHDPATLRPLNAPLPLQHEGPDPLKDILLLKVRVDGLTPRYVAALAKRLVLLVLRCVALRCDCACACGCGCVVVLSLPNAEISVGSEAEMATVVVRASNEFRVVDKRVWLLEYAAGSAPSVAVSCGRWAQIA